MFVPAGSGKVIGLTEVSHLLQGGNRSTRRKDGPQPLRRCRSDIRQPGGFRTGAVGPPRFRQQWQRPSNRGQRRWSISHNAAAAGSLAVVFICPMQHVGLPVPEEIKHSYTHCRQQRRRPRTTASLQYVCRTKATGAPGHLRLKYEQRLRRRCCCCSHGFCHV